MGEVCSLATPQRHLTPDAQDLVAAPDFIRGVNVPARWPCLMSDVRSTHEDYSARRLPRLEPACLQKTKDLGAQPH